MMQQKNVCIGLASVLNFLAFKLPSMSLPTVLHRNDPRAISLGRQPRTGQSSTHKGLEKPQSGANNRTRSLEDEIHEENMRKVQSMSAEEVKDAQVC